MALRSNEDTVIMYHREQYSLSAYIAKSILICLLLIKCKSLLGAQQPTVQYLYVSATPQILTEMNKVHKCLCANCDKLVGGEPRPR